MRGSRRPYPQQIVTAALLLLLSSCDRTDPARPLYDAVEEAHGAWEELGATEYRFEVVSYGVSLSLSREITVEDGCVVAPPDCGFTIDELWRHILEARDRGELHLASFYEHGVPKVVDYGRWEVDGGVHHSIRSFELQ